MFKLTIPDMQNPNNATKSCIIEWRLPNHSNSAGAPLQPYSIRFQDVYYSSDNGLLETDYVFLQGNHLATRWQQLQNQCFTIIETGFGTGLNFLSAAQLWLQHAPKNAVLHFISTEKYPLSLPEITKALQFWAELAPFSAQFLAQYESLKTYTKSVSLFNYRVELTLLIGDATDSLTKIEEIADAWFLDGFSPAKNAEMWHPALFKQMARLSKPETTFATFTSAGTVRRGLQTAGFKVSKVPGFGKKREILTGHFVGTTLLNQSLLNQHVSDQYVLIQNVL